MDELRLLRHFEAVYRLSSFSAAAAELRLTHSAVTKSIKTLEADWGAQLFHRTTRTVEATKAGRKLYPKAVELLSFATSIRKSVSVDELELNILCGPGVIESVIHPAILKFARSHPKTRINVYSMQPHLAAEELRQRRVHLIVFHETSFAVMPHTERMSVTKVVDEPYEIIHRPGADVAAQRPSLEELMSYDWVLAVTQLFEDSLPERLQALVKNNAVPRYRLLSQTACIEMVKESDLLTILPKNIADHLVAKGEFSAMPLPDDFRFAIGAAVLNDADLDPALEHFIQCLQNS